MMLPIHNLCLVLSGCCFALGAWRYGSPDWNRIVCVGLTFLVLSMVVL
jgi:hypothetical protein